MTTKKEAQLEEVIAQLEKEEEFLQQEEDHLEDQLEVVNEKQEAIKEVKGENDTYVLKNDWQELLVKMIENVSHVNKLEVNGMIWNLIKQ